MVEGGNTDRGGEREGVEKNESVEDEVWSVHVDEDDGEGEPRADGDPDDDDNGRIIVYQNRIKMKENAPQKGLSGRRRGKERNRKAGEIWVYTTLEGNPTIVDMATGHHVRS